MTTTQLIQFLRSSVNVSDPNNSEATDSAYPSMTDEDILLYLNVVLSRDFAGYPSLESIPAYSVYPVILLAKKELYYALAVKAANEYDLGADNNNYLKRSQRFDHYMKLAQQADDEYQDWISNGGSATADDGSGAGPNTLTSFDVLLSNRYYTKRYYEKGVVPAPVLYVDNVTETTVEFHWNNRCRKFAWCNVYCSTQPIVDEYKNSQSKIVDKSTLVQHLIDARQVSLRVEGLSPDTTYYLAVELVDQSGLVGYTEVVFDTVGAVDDGGVQ